MLLVCAVLLFELLSDAGRGFLYLPALINLALLGAFCETLLNPPSIAEHIARLAVPVLTAEHVRYCRRVTLVWCCFFALNGAAAAFTAAFCRLAVWALYNGLVSYLLIALLFAAELAYRSWRFRVYSGGPFDALLKRIFPADADGGPAR